MCNTLNCEKNNELIYIVGIKDFIKDFRIYYNVSVDVWADKSLSSFTRRELEIYRQVICILVFIAFIINY